MSFFGGNYQVLKVGAFGGETVVLDNVTRDEAERYVRDNSGAFGAGDYRVVEKGARFFGGSYRVVKKGFLTDEVVLDNVDESTAERYVREHSGFLGNGDYVIEKRW